MRTLLLIIVKLLGDWLPVTIFWPTSPVVNHHSWKPFFATTSVQEAREKNGVYIFIYVNSKGDPIALTLPLVNFGVGFNPFKSMKTNCYLQLWITKLAIHLPTFSFISSIKVEVDLYSITNQVLWYGFIF